MTSTPHNLTADNVFCCEKHAKAAERYRLVCSEDDLSAVSHGDPVTSWKLAWITYGELHPELPNSLASSCEFFVRFGESINSRETVNEKHIRFLLTTLHERYSEYNQSDATELQFLLKLWKRTCKRYQEFESNCIDSVDPRLPVLSWELLANRYKEDKYPKDRELLMHLYPLLYQSFEESKDCNDLKASISAITLLTDNTPNNHTDKPRLLSALMEMERELFEHCGDLDDLNAAIAAGTLAIELAPNDDPDKPLTANNLGRLRYTRFEQLDRLSDLEQAISALSQAVELIPAADSKRPEVLRVLGDLKTLHYARSGQPRSRDISILDAAVTAGRQAVQLTADDHPEKAYRLAHLANALRSRFEHSGATQDLHDALQALSLARELRPRAATASDDDGQARRQLEVDEPYILEKMAITHMKLFEHRGALHDLTMGVELLEQAVEQTPEEHPAKFARLVNLASAVHTRFSHRGGTLEEVERSMQLLNRVLELMPENQPDRFVVLGNLGMAHLERFSHSGTLSDLTEATVLLRHAVALIPEWHTDRAMWLSNLGSACIQHFDHRTDLGMLDEAITVLTQAVALLSDEQPLKAHTLTNLGLAYNLRLSRFDTTDDFEAAIAVLRRAVELTPDGHPDKPPLLSNLYSVMASRPLQDDNLQAILTLLREEVERMPDGHEHKVRIMANIGSFWRERFESLKVAEDADKAIDLLSRVVEMLSDGHTDKPGMLKSLASAYQARFQYTDHPNPNDLESAITATQRAIDLASTKGSIRASLQLNLGGMFLLRNMAKLPPKTPAGDFAEACGMFYLALAEETGHPVTRINAGGKLIRALTRIVAPARGADADPSLLVDVYEIVLGLVPRIAWLGHGVNKRYETLTNLRTVSAGAAAAAISAGRWAKAVEWLNSSRSIVWSQALQLRAPLDRLREQHPQLSARLEACTQALRDDSSEGDRPTDGIRQIGVERPQAHYSAAIQYGELVEQIQKLEGFSDFLQAKTFHQLTAVCASGYVVAVSIDESRCDALILHHAGEVLHVPLPFFSLQQAEKLRAQLHTTLQRADLLGRFRDASFCDPSVDEAQIGRGGRVARKGVDANDELRKILAELWRGVAKPVIDTIRSLPKTPAAGAGEVVPHITWCPTGPLVFLPLHAAGIYTERGTSETIMDFAVSSYTPTLESLLKRQTSSQKPLNAREDSAVPKILVISQPATPGKTAIPCTEREAEAIHTIFPSSTNILNRAGGTVSSVLSKMPEHDWIHFACHGVQNSQDPTQSAFALHDGPLRLSKLMNMDLPNAEFAVLSACQTATGDEKLPEEAVHLAAAMLNVGFKGVLGTMWSISDDTAPKVFKRFYEIMREQVDASKKLQPAYALHQAIMELRRTESLLRWVPFIHLGL